VRFSGDAFSMGIQPDPTGGLALRGPIPAGISGFELTYLLRSGSDRIRFAREFPTGLPLLSIYIADTGVLTETDRLHRRRPLRTTDRSYIHLEAYQVDPGETVAVDVTSLPVAQPLPRLASAGFVVITALVAGLFLTAPLRSPGESGETATTPTTATAAERASLYAAIRDLEDDFDTGKISAEDHSAMRSELRQRAGELLRAERAAAATPATATSQVQVCSDCGAHTPPDTRFCSQCGAKIGDPTGGGERAG
jgi:ribosomal protein L40E